MVYNDNIAGIFPGQGIQRVGMGAAAFTTSFGKEILCQADIALGEELSNLILHGPVDMLNLAYNAQPAILCLCMAMFQIWKHNNNQDLTVLFGHSLGEYTALVAAESLDFPTGIRLLRARGQAMYDHVSQGSMVVVIGPTAKQLQKIIDDNLSDTTLCSISNENTFVQNTIAGCTKEVMMIKQIIIDSGLGKCIELKIDRPFHCPLALNAKEVLAQILNNTEIKPPKIPVMLGGRILSQPDKIREHLVEQLVTRVRWHDSVQYAIHTLGVQKFVEFGFGTLSNMIKELDNSVECYNAI